MFKKRITPFACAITALLTAAATFVATMSATSTSHNAEINTIRQETAIYSQHKNLIGYIGEDGDKYTKLAQMIDIIEGNYIRDYNTDAFWENIYTSLLTTLGDKYAQYLTVEEYQSFLNDRSGGFVGIGVHATQDPDTYGVYIFGVMPNSPAEKGGLKKGDVVTAIGDLKASKDNYYTFIDAIRGEAGSNVTVTVLRDGQEFNLTLTRNAVASENVLYEKLDGNIAYMRILSFSGENVSEEFAQKIALAQKDGCQKFIFDVRNNLGGDLNEICDTLDMLLPEGPIINIVTKDGKTTSKNSDEAHIEGEFVVLCNDVTASAAELFTAALRDYGIAKTVGTKTYGKGSMQTTMLLSDGSALKISTAYYNPPSNKSYDGIGITPDYVVELPEEWKLKFFHMPKEEDTQLQKAISLLTSAK